MKHNLWLQSVWLFYFHRILIYNCATLNISSFMSFTLGISAGISNEYEQKDLVSKRKRYHTARSNEWIDIIIPTVCRAWMLLVVTVH